MTSTASSVDNTLLEIGQVLNLQTSAIRFSAGTRIFEQGQPGDYAYMIDNGYVEISTHNGGKKHIHAILGPGEIIGEIAILDGQPHSATATAMHNSTLIPISGNELQDEIDRGSPITRLIIVSAMNRLRKIYTNEQSDPLHYLDEARLPGSQDAQIQLVRDRAAQQLKLRFDMERAIANQNFELVYQPIVSLNDGRTAGFEALLRWKRSDGRVVFPDLFIPLAEQSGLIVPLGAWVLKNALKSLPIIEHRMRSQKYKNDFDIFISLNVSPRQLECEEDVEKLALLIEQAPVNPACVKLEITEQALLVDPRMAMLGLSRLKATGASIAIDDFGTGYSSLNYLHRFPLDTLKIDRSFISRIVKDKSRQRIVAAIIGLARELEMDVVAEGVEQLDEAKWLRSQSCRYLQGYLITKPVALASALDFLERDFEF